MNPRQCIVTREEKSADDMIRFVLGPENQVVADLKRKLPGRGVWVTAQHDLVQKAASSGIFSKGFKTKVVVPENLADTIENLLHDGALGLLSLAKKAGKLVIGEAKVEKALRNDNIELLLVAKDSSGDGKRKLKALAEQRLDREILFQEFTIDEMDRVLGLQNTVHVGLPPSGIAAKFQSELLRLRNFRTK